MKGRRKTTSIRLPDELMGRIRVAAEERDLSVNWLIVKATEEFMDRLIPADEVRLTRD